MRVNITQWLNKNHGGKWTHIPFRSWWCDDGKRHMVRHCMASCEGDCGKCHWIGYYIYGGEKGCEIVYPQYARIARPIQEQAT